MDNILTLTFPFYTLFYITVCILMKGILCFDTFSQPIFVPRILIYKCKVQNMTLYNSILLTV